MISYGSLSNRNDSEFVLGSFWNPVKSVQHRNQAQSKYKHSLTFGVRDTLS